MSEILTVEEIELIQLAMECLYSELPEYGSISTKLVAMRKAAKLEVVELENTNT